MSYGVQKCYCAVVTLFKGVHDIPVPKDGARLGDAADVSLEGCITSELFLKWAQAFIKFLP
jgi:hypothetical protein